MHCYKETIGYYEKVRKDCRLFYTGRKKILPRRQILYQGRIFQKVEVLCVNILIWEKLYSICGTEDNQYH